MHHPNLNILLSSILCPLLSHLSRNVQTTWRLAWQQLSAHSARNQAVPSDTNCNSSPKTGATTGPAEQRDVTQQLIAAFVIIFRRDALIQANIYNTASCNRFLWSSAEDFCCQEQLRAAYNTRPWNQSSAVTRSSQEKVMTVLQGHVQQGISANLSAAKSSAQLLDLDVLINTHDSSFSRSVEAGRQEFFIITKTNVPAFTSKCLLSIVR